MDHQPLNSSSLEKRNMHLVFSTTILSSYLNNSVKNKYIWCVELSTEVSGWGDFFHYTLSENSSHKYSILKKKKKNVRIKPNEHLQKQTQMLDLRFSGTTLHLCAVKIITEEQTRHSDLTCSGRIFS